MCIVSKHGNKKMSTRASISQCPITIWDTDTDTDETVFSGETLKSLDIFVKLFFRGHRQVQKLSVVYVYLGTVFRKVSVSVVVTKF